MAYNQQNNQRDEQEEYITGMICKCASVGKFLEFFDGMTPAYKKDYAMLQGATGKDYAASSGIRVKISDYSDEKKGSVSASSLVPTHVFDMLKQICIKNLGTTVIPADEALAQVVANDKTLQSGFLMLANGLMDSIYAIIKDEKGSEKSDGKNPLAHVGKAIKDVALFLVGKKVDPNAKGKTIDNQDTPCPVPITTKNYCDYSYSQTRVNSSYPNPDKSVPCKTVQISHTTLSDDGTTKMRLPWVVSISNFNAMPRQHRNGTVSYEPSSIKDKIDLRFSVSEEDMFRCCYAVEHFVAQWERYHLEDFIEGAEARQAKSKKYRDSQN